MIFWDIIVSGEYLIIALVVLVVSVVWMWIVQYRKLVRDDRKYDLMLNKIRDFISDGDIESAVGTCLNTNTPAARVAAKGLSLIGNPMPVIISSMNQEITAQKENIGTGLQWFRFIAVISPLLGLGGTLAGIWWQLDNITSSGIIEETQNIPELIAPTLFTTIAGLFAGIFALFAFTCLNGRVKKSVQKLYEAASDAENILNHPS